MSSYTVTRTEYFASLARTSQAVIRFVTKMASDSLSKLTQLNFNLVLTSLRYNQSYTDRLRVLLSYPKYHSQTGK